MSFASTSVRDVSITKRKPFVSTSKTSESFGNPSPLPPRPPSPEKRTQSPSN